MEFHFIKRGLEKVILGHGLKQYQNVIRCLLNNNCKIRSFFQVAHSKPVKLGYKTDMKEIKPNGSTIIVPVIKLFSNTVALRIILLALTTLLNVISEQLGYAGTSNVSADVNSEGI